MPPVVAPWMGSSRAIVVLPSHCRRAHAVGCGAGRAWGGAAQPASSRPESTRLAALNKAVSPLSGRQRSLGHRMLPARHQLVGAVLVQRGHEAALGLPQRSEEHTSELQSPCNLVCRLLLEKKKNKVRYDTASDSSLNWSHVTTATGIFSSVKQTHYAPIS